MKSLVLRFVVCILLCGATLRSCVLITDSLAIPAEYEVSDLYNKQSVDLNLSSGQIIAITKTATFHAESRQAFQFLLSPEKSITSTLGEAPLGWQYNEYWVLDGELSPGAFKVTVGNPQIRIKGDNFRVTVMQKAETYTTVNVVAVIILIILFSIIIFACFYSKLPRLRIELLRSED